MNESITVTHTRSEHFDQIAELSRRVYPVSSPWRADQLESHLRLFPDGQFVAIDASGSVVGVAASLIIRWDDYGFRDSWRDFTDAGLFTNHDPIHGHTLYGAEIMVSPDRQGCGIGSLLYDARRRLTERLGLWRIRAAARLRGFHRFADRMSIQDYVSRILSGDLKDPTLSFQLKHGFKVLAVIDSYLQHDPESRGYAAVIEWRNPTFSHECGLHMPPDNSEITMLHNVVLDIPSGTVRRGIAHPS